MLEETNVDDLSDAAIIRGMWAAAEDAAGDDDEAEDGDRLLEQLDPAEVCSARCWHKHVHSTSMFGTPMFGTSSFCTCMCGLQGL
jgi:hypothetical protein